MSKEFEFFVYLLERYADYKRENTASILKKWDEKDLTQFIYDMYDIYHVERLENAFLDIDSLMEKGKPAW